jgi:hypothetical protein
MRGSLEAAGIAAILTISSINILAIPKASEDIPAEPVIASYQEQFADDVGKHLLTRSGDAETLVVAVAQHHSSSGTTEVPSP